MTVDDFLACDPCIEEVDGFIHGLTVQKLLTEDAHAALTTRLAALKSGRVVPCNTTLPRTWHYTLGKPAKRFTRVEIAVLEESLRQASAMRLSRKLDERRATQRRQGVMRRNSVIE
jgi:hypothetical protein